MANVPISAFTVPANTVGIGATGYSLTGSASASFMDLAGTWNTTGTPTLIKANVTDTASNAASLLMDLQVGGASQFSISKAGRALVGNGTLAAPAYSFVSDPDTGFYKATNNDNIIRAVAGGVGALYISESLIQIGINSSFGWSSGGVGSPTDLLLSRRNTANLRFGAADAAAPVAQTLSVQSVVAGTTNTAGAALTITGSQGTGTGAGGSIIFQVAPAGSSGTAQNALATFAELTSARAFNLYNTFTDASNYERVGLTWAGNIATLEATAAGTGTVRSLVIGGGGNNLTFLGSGSKTMNGNLNMAGSISFPSDNTNDIGAVGPDRRPRNLYMGSWIRMAVTTVASLPAAATAGAGARMFVSDASVPVFGSAVAGGGAVTVPVYSTGAAWNVG